MASSVLDQDAAHGLGGRSEEMTAVLPVRRLLGVHQAEVGLVDQGGRLQRLAGPLPGQLVGRQTAEFVVDQRQELLGGVRVARLDCRQDPG